MQEKGLKLIDEKQFVDGISIYPNDYFNPFDDITGVLRKTPNTRTIHWYAKTWADNNSPLQIKIKRLLHRYMGTSFTTTIKSLLKS